MSLFKEKNRKLFRFYLSNMDERNQQDPMAYSNLESLIPTICAMVVHENVMIGEVDLMFQIDEYPVSTEEMFNAFKKFGFIIRELKEDQIIEKSFLGFKWSKT